MNWRELPPIPENERPEQTGRVSQTLLGKSVLCRRSAYLYLRHKEPPPSHEMDRGSVFHETVRRGTELLIEQGEQRLPWEIGKDMLAEVVAEHPGWHIPPKEMDALRMMVYHWCEGTTIDPGQVLAVERIFELPIGGFTLRGKVDLALGWDSTVAVRDYKTGYRIPSQEEFDASLQTVLYALLIAEGTPEGEMPLGERAQTFDLAEVYPAYLWEEGLATRGRVVSRPELLDLRLYVEAELAKLRHAFETGEWPALPGSHCSTCPAPGECPLPEKLRDHAGTVNTMEEAAEAAEWWLFQKQRLEATWKELKGFADFAGPVRFGRDLVLEFSEEERRKTDYEALEAAVERAVSYGEPFDPSEHIRVSRSTRFKRRTLSAEELAAERIEDEAA